MAGFFRGFINKFASLAHPLYRLLQEDVSFYFGVEELEAFEQLKRVLLHSPFLAFFDTDASIRTILTTDASGVGLGATLSQVQDGKEKPVYFISQETTCQRNSVFQLGTRDIGSRLGSRTTTPIFVWKTF